MMRGVVHWRPRRAARPHHPATRARGLLAERQGRNTANDSQHKPTFMKRLLMCSLSQKGGTCGLNPLAFHSHASCPRRRLRGQKERGKARAATSRTCPFSPRASPLSHPAPLSSPGPRRAGPAAELLGPQPPLVPPPPGAAAALCAVDRPGDVAACSAVEAAVPTMALARLLARGPMRLPLSERCLLQCCVFPALFNIPRGGRRAEPAQSPWRPFFSPWAGLFRWVTER